MQVRSSAHRRLSALSLADGGVVEKLKHRIFGRPAPAQHPAPPARAASSPSQAQPDPKASARARLGGLNLDALRRREEEAGLKDGGVVPRTGRIRGPGTGTSDSIPARMPVGSFVLPADSTEELANVRVSNGETALAPEVVQRIGAAALMAMRDGTHHPMPGRARRSAPQRLASGGEVEQKRGASFGDAAAVAQNPASTVVQSAPASIAPAPASSSERGSDSSIGGSTGLAASAPSLALAPQGGDAAARGGSSFGDAAAASLDSRVAQIPSTGYPAAPDGNRVDSTELARNAYNAMMALPGAAPALAGAARAMGTVRGMAASGLGGMGLANTANQVADSPRAEPAASTPASAAPMPAPAAVDAPKAPAEQDFRSPGQPPAPPPAPYDLSNGKDVGFGVKRFDGGSSPLFTNVPDAANNAALMGRGQVSEQNMRAADALQAREDERFRRDQAVEQYNREVAQAQATNSRPVTSTGESVGIRRESGKVLATLASNANYNRQIGADSRSQDRALKRDEINASLQQALNSEEGRNTRAGWEADLGRSRLDLETRRSDVDARSKMNMLGAQDAYLSAKTPEARSAALANLRALAGQSTAPTFTAVKGEKRSDGSADADRVISSTGEWIEPPRPQRMPPAAAIEQLRRNPQMAAQFDQHYGKGASAQVLGR